LPPLIHRLRRTERWDRSGLLLVRWVGAVELAQQGRPFDLGRFFTAADEAIMGGADDLVGDRVERGARLLEGQLHRAGPLHAISGDKCRGDAGADDYIGLVVWGQAKLFGAR
jgi:hypothetical protein